MKCWNLIALVVTGAILWFPRPVAVDPVVPFDKRVSTEIHLLISHAVVEGLRWPDISDLQSSLTALYAPRDYATLWLTGDPTNGKAIEVINELSRAAERGLDPGDYDVSHLLVWQSQLHDRATWIAAGAARFDLALTIALMRYAQALHQGRIDPQTVRFAIRRKQPLDLAEFVQQFLASGETLNNQLEAIEPPFHGYHDTQDALANWIRLAAQETSTPFACPRLQIRPNWNSSDIPWLTARLTFFGDLQASSNTTGNKVYSGAVVNAVKRFQARHGLDSNGIVDTPTCRALLTPLSRRVEQLQLTLERWRWLPSSLFPAIVINIPEFELRAFDRDGRLGLRMHVIVGKAYRHRTPVFEDTIERVIIRPYWNVPDSIVAGEILPALRADPDYLRKHDYQPIDDHNRLVAVNSEAGLFDQLSAGRIRLRQLPGPANSLGLLKFDFPNAFDVYLHGTPAQHLFARSRRDFSHGCIRVEDPASLAAWALREQSGWTRNRIVAAAARDRTIEIPIRSQLTVLVLYGTAVVEEDDTVHFYEDLYGYDVELAKALRHGYPYK